MTPSDTVANLDGDEAFLYNKPSRHVSSQSTDDVLKEGTVSGMEEGGAADGVEPYGQTVIPDDVDVIRKRKRSTEGVSATLGTDTMPTRLSSAMAEADHLERWLVGAAAIDSEQRPASATGSTEVYNSEAQDSLSLFCLLERESDAAESLRADMMSWS
jgi:hypothetical protein